MRQAKRLRRTRHLRSRSGHRHVVADAVRPASLPRSRPRRLASVQRRMLVLAKRNELHHVVAAVAGRLRSALRWECLLHRMSLVGQNGTGTQAERGEGVVAAVVTRTTWLPQRPSCTRARRNSPTSSTITTSTTSTSRAPSRFGGTGAVSWRCSRRTSTCRSTTSTSS